MELYRGEIETVRLLESEKSVKRDRDLAYLMELNPQSLLLPFYTESGLSGPLNCRLADLPLHDGWDNPLCQIRGTFTGHWLSAAARIFQETGDMQLKARADFIVSEIGKCQERNGNGWAFPIPEKYLYGLKRGQHFWAPQYVCHKVMMGLLDMYRFADSATALEIVKGCAGWFAAFTGDISREQMDDMMDLEETGGIMELWADLYAVTKDPAHLELMRRYERPRLTEPLLRGEDVLTNMHANMTIPEIHGCARAYEVTGEERYRRIAENYWEQAVTLRGTFATGGQTDGEVWTAKGRQSARLSALNQEHCTVYNMIRLADYLFRWTGDSKYQDYMERNIENGLMGQGFWEADHQNKAEDALLPASGLISYFLPLEAGSRKVWGSKTQDFWCCHGTLVQANAKYREYVFYSGKDSLTVGQFIPASAELKIGEVPVSVTQKAADLGGSYLYANPVATGTPGKPDYVKMVYEIDAPSPAEFSFRVRMPWWLQGEMEIRIDGKRTDYGREQGHAVIRRRWEKNRIEIVMSKGISCWPLADEPDTVAFLDGPVVLAGLVAEERTLIGDPQDPSTMIAPHHEREWSNWTSLYRTANQMRGFYFKPLKEIGNQAYTVYFPVRKIFPQKGR